MPPNSKGRGRITSSSATEKPVVLVYAEPLLARSMTFVRTQAEALNSFSPYYISPHWEREGLPLPMERVAVMRRSQGPFSRLTEVPFKLLGVAPFFARRLRRLRPALLHAHFGFAGLRALPLARTLGIPLVVTFQGCDATMYDEFLRASSFYSGRVYVRQRKVLDASATLFIAVSHFIRDEMLRQGFSSKKIAVHYVGVDTETFSPEAGVKRESFVLFTGRLDEKKGCEYLIRAMGQVQKQLPAVELVLIGDGALRQPLEQLAHQHLSRYRFLGFQSPEAVRHWMSRARLFAAPSIRARSGDAEGYPNVFAEAQSMGLPVVSFSSDGVREAVVHGKTGLLAPEKNVEALADHLRELCSNPALCAKMGEAARVHVCTHFNLRIQTRKLEELYIRALGKHKAQPISKMRAESDNEEPLGSGSPQVIPNSS